MTCCQTISRIAPRNDRSSHVQRITQTVHEATQHAVNHSLHEEAIDWAELGVALSSSAQALARNFRVLSLSNLQLGRVEMAGTFANQAYEADKSKKSLLALFRANIRDEPGRDAPSKEHTKYLLSLLVRQHDFRFEDLLVFGKASNEAKDDESTLLVLEEMIGLLRSQRQSKSAPIPAGVILQNAGQLAYNAVEKRNSDTSTVFIKRFKALSESFVEFAEQLAPGDVADFGPVETFEWFYAMSFMLGKSLEDSEMFLSASRVAQLANELYGDKSPLHAQQSQSLLACIAMDMASFETHDIEYLKQILVLIDQYGTMKKELSHETADTESFLFSINVHWLRQSSLQIMLQGTSVDTSKFSYLFRRLINLADEPSQVSEWLDQLLQLSESMGLNISGDDIEWFTGRAWNMVCMLVMVRMGPCLI
ncbi:TPA: LOW QUALITY PROTEIN: hypothetical protein N0F65_001194 [Lagenidium giganteum]|uniref:Uncharacterized protein n=1 Tax=Lagenidium giganteum TaxID=4803 RepID=A0AAV2Z5T6_9STRA|nr:TPA: LOW QUALITY PROTEIN: hypothetical protein N0F65_001194 [Lagenidium giganteum]